MRLQCRCLCNRLVWYVYARRLSASSLDAARGFSLALANSQALHLQPGQPAHLDDVDVALAAVVHQHDGDGADAGAQLHVRRALVGVERRRLRPLLALRQAMDPVCSVGAADEKHDTGSASVNRSVWRPAEETGMQSTLQLQARLQLKTPCALSSNGRPSLTPNAHARPLQLRKASSPRSASARNLILSI